MEVCPDRGVESRQRVDGMGSVGPDHCLSAQLLQCPGPLPVERRHNLRGGSDVVDQQGEQRIKSLAAAVHAEEVIGQQQADALGVVLPLVAQREEHIALVAVPGGETGTVGQLMVLPDTLSLV